MAHCEKTEPVQETPTNLEDLREELTYHAKNLDVIWHLQTYAAGLKLMDIKTLPPAAYYLLELDIQERRLHIGHYKAKQLDEATTDANELERNEGSDVVLVSVSDLNALRRVYPNYFADTSAFLERVSAATGLLLPKSKALS